MKYFHLLWRNLLRRKVRTTFTFLSIFVAFVLFGLLAAIRNGFDAGIEIAGANRLLTIHKVSIIQQLPLRHLAEIRAISGVEMATHFCWFGGVYQDPKNFFAQLAVVPEELLRLYPEYVIDDEQRERWIATRTGAIAGVKLAERFGWKIGDRIPIQPTFWRPTDGKSATYEFELVGLYRGATPDIDETGFYFHYDYLTQRTGDRGMTGWFALSVSDPERAGEIAQAIDARFANSSAETKTATEKAFVQSFAHQIGDTGAMLSMISAVVFFVILLIAGNTMAQSVRERTAELGVLKTLGFTDVSILLLVLGESILLAGVAGGLGIALVTLAAPAFGKLVEAFLPIFYVPPRAVAQGVAFALLLGLAGGGLPAFFAQRLSIVEALRNR